MQIEDGVDVYMNKVGCSVLLTAARERELSVIIRTSKDPQAVASAVEEFVMANLKLVASEAFDYAKRCGSYMKTAGFDVHDLISAGHVGLMKAVYKYDPAYQTKFSTYAVPWIRQPIRKFIYRSSPINIPSYIMNDAIKHKKLEEENEDVTDAELMDKLQLTQRGLANVKMARYSRVSLDAPVSNDGEGDSEFMNMMPDENAVDPSQEASDEDRYAYLREALDELDDMKKEIIMAQCFSDDKVNLAELGEKWGVTGERIRQIKKEALQKLKVKLAKKGIRLNK